MSKIIFIVSFFVLFNSYAESFKRLNQGACYVSEDSTQAKVASFNIEKSFILNLRHILDLKTNLKSIGFKDKDLLGVDTFIHCSDKARVVFNILTSKDNLCIWTNIEDSKLKIETMDLSLYRDGFCSGTIDDRLIVSFNDQEVNHNFKEIQLKSGLKIKAYKKIRDNVYLIVFDNDRKGSMSIFELKKLIQSESYVSYVDHVSRQRPIGDKLLLDSFSGKFKK